MSLPLKAHWLFCASNLTPRRMGNVGKLMDIILSVINYY